MTKYFWAYTISVLVAIPVTYFWSSLLHKAVLHSRQQDEKEAERISWIPLLVGIFERAIITTLVGWNVSGAAGFIGTWIAIKSAGGWTTWSKGTTYGRATLFVGLLGSALSVAFALLGGLIIAR